MYSTARAATTITLTLALANCKHPKEPTHTTESETGQVCAGVPVDGPLCFSVHSFPEFEYPRAACGGAIGQESSESIVIQGRSPSVITSVTTVDGVLVLSPPVPLDRAAEQMLRLAYIDGDALPELIWTSVLKTPGYLPNMGGTFGSFKPFVLPGEFGEGRLVPIDIDGDGRSELFKGSNASARLWQMVDGAWTPQGPSFDIPSCYAFWDAVVADFTGDGRDDMAFIGSPGAWDAGQDCQDPPDGEIKILVTNAQLNALEEKGSIFTLQPSEFLVSGDFDGDGFLDLAAASQSPMTLVAMRGYGNGEFGAPQPVAEGVRAVSGDFDGDDIDELATMRYTEDGQNVEVWIIDSVFSDPTSIRLDGLQLEVLAAADVNSDGVDDLAGIVFGDPPAHLLVLLSQM